MQGQVTTSNDSPCTTIIDYDAMRAYYNFSNVNDELHRLMTHHGMCVQY